MTEFPLPVKSLWQAPAGWLCATLLCGLGLLWLYQYLPPSYRRLLRNGRWLAIPYLGLITGGISPRFMGLTGINWFSSFGYGLVLIGGVLLILTLVRSMMALSVAAPTVPATAAASPTASPRRRLTLVDNSREQQYARSFSNAFFTLGAEEFHLAFLRSAVWEIFLTTAPAMLQANYWAAWSALLLAIPESLFYQPTATQRLCKVALLAATTVLFIFTRNFWLSWLLHLLGWIVLAPSALREKHP